MPSLPIFLFFSGLFLGLFLGPILVHFLKIRRSAWNLVKKLAQPG